MKNDFIHTQLSVDEFEILITALTREVHFMVEYNLPARTEEELLEKLIVQKSKLFRSQEWDRSGGRN
jgi:hypothetical protein